jgi:hypothetical protein
LSMKASRVTSWRRTKSPMPNSGPSWMLPAIIPRFHFLPVSHFFLHGSNHPLHCNFQDISVTQHFWINNIKRSIYIHDENIFIYWLLSHFIWHQSNLVCKLLENIVSPVCHGNGRKNEKRGRV